MKFACPAHDLRYGGDDSLSAGCGGCDPVAIATMAGRGTASATPRQDAVNRLLQNRARQIRAMTPSEVEASDSPDWEMMMMSAQVCDELAAAQSWEDLGLVDQPRVRGVAYTMSRQRRTGGLSL